MDLSKLRNGDWHRPEATVDVPELVFLFAEGEAPVLRVVGLSGNDYWCCLEAKKPSSVVKIITDAVTNLAKDHAEEIRDILTRVVKGEDLAKVHPEVAFRIEIVLRGVVKEDGTRLFEKPDVVRMCKHFSAAFYRLAMRIQELSDGPSTLGESQNGTAQMSA